MKSGDFIRESIEDMKHCKDTGSIVFQMPEDEDIVDIIITGLERLIYNKPSDCESCSSYSIKPYVNQSKIQDTKVKKLEKLLEGIEDRTVPLNKE